MRLHKLTLNQSLIMLLIQSDMFKSLWFLVFPVVTFTTGPVNNDDPFCHVDGFFLALGIEASGLQLISVIVTIAHSL